MNNHIIMNEEFGWKQYQVYGLNFWFKGYLLGTSLDEVIQQAIDLYQKGTVTMNSVSVWARGLRGHFALVLESENFAIAIVDKDRSIPLFYSTEKTGSLVSSYAPDLLQKLQLDTSSINYQAALEIAMSGYTIGCKSLYEPILQLVAGSFLLYQNDKLKVESYYNYQPWKLRETSEKELKFNLTEITLNMMKDMINSLDGRQAVIPLSAGNDSRLIASALKELNYKNVHCVSYGLKGNFEAETAKLIAERLGYKWTFIPVSLKSQKKKFNESSFGDFLKFSDTLSSSPTLIDYSVVSFLKNNMIIDDDAIFINGNTGDFISGAHISSYMPKDSNYISDFLISNYINKHYSLWKCLKTKANIKIISLQLQSYVDDIIGENVLSPELLWTVGENMEWIGRQSKWVSVAQRSYEFHGYEWRMPLWDPVFMDFWEGVPYKHKINQKIYKDMLIENNWGGVWENIDINDHKIASLYLRLLRTIFKLPFLLIGKKSWHQFDKKFFAYFLDNTAATAIVSYSKVIFDKCGARDRNSWLAKKYLSKHGINIKDL